MTPRTSTNAHSIMSLTLQISREMRRHFMSMAKRQKGLNMLQLHAIALISEHEGVTMKDFADMLCITAPSATSFVDRLVRDKLITRKTDPKNRRVVRLRVTDSGKRLMKQATDKRAEVLTSIINLLPASDQRTFVRILGNLSRALENHSHSSL